MQPRATIDLTDDDVKNVGATSNGEATGKSHTISPRRSEVTRPHFVAIDRKQMEAERLARVNKTKIGIQTDRQSGGSSSLLSNLSRAEKPALGSNSESSRASKRRKITDSQQREPTKVVNLDDDDDDHPHNITPSSTASKPKTSISKPASSQETKVIDLSSPVLSARSSQTEPQSQQTLNRASQPGALQYPHGTVKRTWAFKHDRQNDVKIEEVLQKTTLKTAVLSSFQWDVEWLESKLRPETKIVMVMQAKEQEVRDQYINETKSRKNLELCFPPMPGMVNCMHSKLMLLFHHSHLRIVVPSANLVPYDWGEGRDGGVMENSVFLIDLPRLAEGLSQAKEDLPKFGQSLLGFLESMDLLERARKGVLNFNFTNTSSLAFVHTVGGSHLGYDSIETGYFGLNKAIRDLNLQTVGGELELDIVSASIGSLNDHFLGSLYLAAEGAELPRAGVKLPSPKLNEKVRIFFPTQATVQASTGGPDNAGTICVQKKWWEADTFPKQLFHDHRSVRSGLLSHNKIIFARAKSAPDANGRPKAVAWAYIGSANLSESAWGKLVVDRAKKESKLNCRNWECGVLVSIPEEQLLKDQELMASMERDPGDLDDFEKAEDVRVPSMRVFNEIVDVPMQWPSEKIGKRRPWFFME